MATEQWTSGTGDWFSNNWLNVGTLRFGGPPQSGDTGDNFAGGDVTRLHADFTTHSEAALRIWRERGCAPLLLEGEALGLLRWRLLKRAEALGHRRTADPRLRLFADDRPLATRRRGERITADLPDGADRIRLASRIWVPLHMLPDPGGDARRLGVAVADVLLDGKPVPLDDARLAGGWHAPEPDCRWTDGDAVILAAGARALSLRLALAGTYWCEPPRPRKAARG